MAEARGVTHTTGDDGPGAPSSGAAPAAAGRASMDPADEDTPQPSQQAAAGSAPRGPPMQLEDPEDTGTSSPSAVATILCALLGPAAGQLVLHSTERALDTSQQWLNRYLPLGERQAVDGAAEGPDSASARDLRHSRLLPLGSLPDDARSRAVALVQQLRQKWLDTPHHLAQLQHILNMTLQSLAEPLHNSQETWACRNQAQANPCPHPACSGTQARPAEGCGTPVMPPGQGLATGRMLARRLQDSLVQLRARAGQLPALLQQAAQRAQRGVAVVHGAVGRAGPLWELLGTVVAWGREVVAQAWGALVVFLLQHPLVPRLEDAPEDAAEDAGMAAPPRQPPKT